MHDHYDDYFIREVPDHDCYSDIEVAEAKQVMRAGRRQALDTIADELVERYDWDAAEHDLSREGGGA